MIKTEIQLKENIYSLAEEHAKVEGITVDEYISKRVEEMLKPKKSIMDFVGIFHFDEETNFAETHNDIYDMGDK